MVTCRPVGVWRKILLSSDNDKRGGRGRSHGRGGGLGSAMFALLRFVLSASYR